jgi:thiol-disulfide isomerase/thioredoxin
MKAAVRLAAALLAALLAGVVLTGCSESSPDIEFPGKARIDVDTPELRAEKHEAGVEPCRPGTSAGASDLPAVTLPCFGGGPDVDLSSLRGPLVVNIWAGWCGPCRKEMPVLAQFHRQYGDQVGVIGVDYLDPQTGSAMDLVKESGVTYPLLADPQQDLLGAKPFPTMFTPPMFAFVRADGSVEVVAQLVDSIEEMVGLVEEHLGVRL